jgi:hypothetical protein
MAKIGEKWERVTLSDAEVRKALDELLKFNMNELTRVVNAVLNNSLMAESIGKQEIIKMLFERQGMASFTYINNVLDEKIHNLKSEGWKPKKLEQPKSFYKAKEVIADDEPDMVAGGDEIEEESNPFETPKIKGEAEEYEEVKEGFGEVKKKRGFLR